MTPRSKKIIGWLVGVFVIFPLVISILVTVFAPSDVTSSSSSNSGDQSTEVTLQNCVQASSEDLKNLTDGLTDKSYSLVNAFKSDFVAEDINQIKVIFPSYISPRVVAAEIKGVMESSNIGLWGIQEYDYGWRILALNEVAKRYSTHGVDIQDDSASGRVRSKILELSPNTSASECAKRGG